jgi:MoaA/NifB/PqqE/SkfB family radical SAM enzyme
MKNLKDIVITDRMYGLEQMKKLLKTISVNEIDEVLKTGKAEKWAVEEIEKYVKKECPAEYNIYIELGKYYLSRDTRKAIENFEEYVKLGGGNEEVMLLLAKLLKETVNIEKAKKIIGKITEETAEVLREKVQLGGANEKIEATEKLLKKGFAKETDIEEVLECYIQAGKENRLHEIINSFGEINNYKLERTAYSILKNSDKECLKQLFRLVKKYYDEADKAELRHEITTSLIRKEKFENLLTEAIEVLCLMIEADDAESGIIESLSLLLQRQETREKKEEVIKILQNMNKKSKRVRAANIFLNEAEILERKIVLKSNPRQMIVELTTKCNLKCIMCDHPHKHQYDINDNCFSYIKQVIPSLEKVRWQGGEVFLYKNFKQLIELAGQHNVQQEFVTNGLLLTQELIELIAKYNIHITFSIDAVDKQTYEKIRCGGSFDKLLENLNMLKQHSINIKKITYSMITVILPFNYKEIQKLLDFALSYGFDTISFQNYINYGNNELLLSDTQQEEVINIINELKEKNYPIIIDTNIVKQNLNDNTSVFLQDDIKQHNNGESTFFDADSYNIMIKKYKTIEKQLQSENNTMFCLSPWKVMCLYSNTDVRFACQSNAIKTTVPYEKLWNSAKVLEYRRLILENSKTMCNAECYNNGEYSYKTRLGLL